MTIIGFIVIYAIKAICLMIKSGNEEISSKERYWGGSSKRKFKWGNKFKRNVSSLRKYQIKNTEA